MAEGVLVLVALVVIALVVRSNQNARMKRLIEAKSAYQDSLSHLKERPTDADLKQQTLALGRHYSNLTRDQQGVTVFDEVALSNDINAACAGASAYSNPTPTGQSAEARLSRLADLKTKGLIAEEEYQAQRRKILSEL